MNIEELTKLIEEAEELNNKGNFVEAEKSLHSILLTMKLSPNLMLKSRALVALSASLWRQGKPTESLPIALNSLELIAIAKLEQSVISTETEAKSLANIGRVYTCLSDYQNAQDYYNQSMEMSVELGLSENIAKVSGDLGIVFSNISNYQKSLEYFNQALEIYEELDLTDNIPKIYGTIGHVYNRLSDNHKALEYFNLALELSEKLDLKNNIAFVTGNIGNVCFDLGDYKKAIEYYNRSFELSKQLGIKHDEASLPLYIGNVYNKLTNYSKALEYYNLAFELSEKLGLKINLAFITLNIGNVYNHLFDYSKSLEYYNRSFELSGELGLSANKAVITGNIGSIFGNPEFEGFNVLKAEEYLLNAINLNKEIGIKLNLYENHKVLSDLYKLINRWEDFAVHFVQFHDIEKEVVSEEAKKQAELMDYRRKIEESERDRQVKIARFQEREKILDNILPTQITERLIKGEQPIADRAENVSIFFSDIVGFTSLSQTITANELVTGLNSLFIKFDLLAKEYGLEKIKTIGDAYMAVCGVPVSVSDHAVRMARFALGIQKLFAGGVYINGHNVKIRIGLHCGEVVAGVIGEQKFAYDLWGDAVNTASRMESHGEPNQIHISQDFCNELISTNLFSIDNFIDRGKMEIKGKGVLKTYFLIKS